MLARTTRFIAAAIGISIVGSIGPVVSVQAQSVPVYAQGANVSVTYLRYATFDSDALYWYLTPGSSTNQLLFDTRTSPIGSTVAINHVFTPGEEVVFGLMNNSQNFLSYSGPSSRNSDGNPHFWIYQQQGDSLSMSPDDRSGESSNYYKEEGSLQFKVVSSGSSPVTTTPEPSSMALLGTGLVGLVPMIRRRRKA